ncbi:Uma2 family endonuclease [Euzebya rosea]|uniref:Uma2 family endonuclease n=1 Tax=Euzebya rosea TaxID=2052804 RepID=UPI000D3E0532|nr:Uma2 family endonuclease [Euzebya rosea]
MPSMSTAEIYAELAPHLRRLTVDDYYGMLDAGLLQEDDRVELLRGVIVEMSPTNPPHHLVVEWLTMWVARRVAEGLHVRVQSPWSAAIDSEPEPDLVVAPAGWHRRPASRRSPHEAALMVEVADSSLRRDLLVKAAIYAEAGVADYWVVDVIAEQVVVHRDPVDGVYQSVQRVGSPEVLIGAGVDVPLGDLFSFVRGE